MILIYGTGSIYIRKVPEDQTGLERFEKAFREIKKNRWTIFEEVDEIDSSLQPASK